MFLNVLAVVTTGAMTGEVVEAVTVTWEEEEEILQVVEVGVVVYVESNVPR